ncbi:MAG: hypothetical protein M1812_000190 [Candelaria pacifica]|nr:MAG: hypothetical protein M1812_000190 [Candelaria pacifica]
MSTATKKPIIPNITDHRPLMTPPTGSTNSLRGSTRSPTPSTTSTGTGPNRARSIRASQGTPISARGAVKRSGANIARSNSSDLSMPPLDQEDEDAKAESLALMEELKLRVHKAETASEEYQRQLSQLQTRLGDSLKEQERLEDRTHQADERIVGLEDERRESLRQRKEVESEHEAERASMLREREEQAQRDEDSRSVIQRLKEALAQKEMRASLDDDSRASRNCKGIFPKLSELQMLMSTANSRSNSSPSLEAGHYAPSSLLQRSSSSTNSTLILQKDKVIESLRLELAEAQIKSIEAENMEGGRSQALEKSLMETRVTNARLMEENESFQLLLSEKTLQGGFSSANLLRGTTSHSDEGRPFGGGDFSSSLADELESATDGENENHRRLEVENRSLKDQNKALSLYINSIIERLLNHKDFEAILDKTPGLMAGPNAASVRHAGSVVEEDIPPKSPEEPAVPTSFLQRAKSVAIGAGRSRPRPTSMMPPPTIPPPPPPKINETLTGSGPGPSLTRSASTRSNGHRRANSEFSHAAIVNNMYRGPPSNGSISPAVVPNPRQNPFFGALSNQTKPEPPARNPSGSLAPGERAVSSSNSTVSEYSGEVDSPSPPRSLAGSANSGTAAIVTGNKLRPLRLVQENVEMGSGDQGGGRKKSEIIMDDDVAAAKKAKRGSWMGWFNKGKEEEAPMRATSSEGIKEHY